MTIKKTLEHLSKIDLKTFHFHLADYDKSTYKPIPKSKLENNDIMDTAKLMTGHYGSEALQVTKDILHEINQRDLAHKLEKNTGKTTNANIYMNSEIVLTLFFSYFVENPILLTHSQAFYNYYFLTTTVNKSLELGDMFLHYHEHTLYCSLF